MVKVICIFGHVLVKVICIFGHVLIKVICIFGHVLIKVICSFGHVLTVSCFAKNLIPLCTFLKLHADVEVNSARLFQNVFNKCSRVLNLVFSRKSNFS